MISKRVAILVVLLTASSVHEAVFAVVRLAEVQGTDRVRLRSAPEIRPDTVLTNAREGTRFPLLEEAEGWVKVALPDGSFAWISRSYVDIQDVPAAGWIKAEKAPLYLEPRADAGLLRTVEAGTLVVILEEQEDWIRVALPTKLEGWLPVDVLQPLTSPEEGQAAESPKATTAQRSPGVDGSVQSVIPEAEGQAQEQGPEQPQEGARVEGKPTEPTGEAEDGTGGGALPEESPLEQSAVTTVQTTVLTGTTGSPAESSTRAEGLLASDWRAWLPYLVAFLAVSVLFWWWRRRRWKKVAGWLDVSREGSGSAPGSREFRRHLKELEERRSTVEATLKEKFYELKGTEAASGLSGTGRQELSQRLGELKSAAEQMEKRLEVLSDVLALQSELLEVLQEENDTLRKALRL